MPEEPPPQTVGPPAAQKPIPSKKWGMAAVVFAIVLFILLDLVTGIQRTTPQRAVSKQAAKAMDPAALRGFDSDTKQMADDLRRQREALQASIEKAGSVDLSRLTEPVPECNQSMRDTLGSRYYATGSRDGSVVRLACEANNQWVVIPQAADSIQPLTPQQRRAIGAESGSGGARSTGESAAEHRKQEAQKRRDEALNSSSVALDFVLQDERKKAVSATAAPAVFGSAPALDQASDRTGPEAPKYAWDTYAGPVYRVFEGSVIETVLTNRLNGEFTGPVNVMVTTDLYSHNHQHILMPQGTRILGEALKVSAQQQHRLAVIFHRAIMPDGYSVDFDKFAGLDQQGATGLTGNVNTHWAKVIGTAVLVGAIGGLAQLGSSGSAYGPGVGIETGIGSQSSQQAVQILDRALNVLPTVTVYEGTRVRIWVEKDAELPAYESHTVSPSL